MPAICHENMYVKNIDINTEMNLTDVPWACCVHNKMKQTLPTVSRARSLSLTLRWSAERAVLSAVGSSPALSHLPTLCQQHSFSSSEHNPPAARAEFTDRLSLVLPVSPTHIKVH